MYEDSKNMTKIHFIAIGGAIMHQLALALQKQGYEVTGSDDEITDPASGVGAFAASTRPGGAFSGSPSSATGNVLGVAS